MTTYNPGDRLRVTFEGVVDDAATYVDLKPRGFVSLQALTDHGATIERILPPLVVGEPVPLDRLDELPVGSVIAAPGCNPLNRRDSQWCTGMTAVIVSQRDYILLRLGDGTE